MTFWAKVIKLIIKKGQDDEIVLKTYESEKKAFEGSVLALEEILNQTKEKLEKIKVKQTPSSAKSKRIIFLFTAILTEFHIASSALLPEKVTKAQNDAIKRVRVI